MVRVALLAGIIALALVVQVPASGGVQVAMNEIMNSTDSAFHNDPTIDHFLRPDSKVDSTLQGSLQKFKELETAPYCNKMASSALIHTCATLKGDNEAQDSMEDTLNHEKKLFAARFSVCELSDSADRSLVPAACASFILTESNTKQKGWFAYYSTKGREKSVPRYPEYDQATRQGLDQCVTALQSSPVTGISYSNAKQTGHQWCSIARVDIENDKLLQTHRALTENLAHQNDILHSHAETLRQQMEATQFLSKQLRAFARNTMDVREAIREVLNEARESVHNLMEDLGVKLQTRLEDSMQAHEAHDAIIKAKADNLFSKIMNATAQQSTGLQLARRRDAEEFSRRLSFAAELVDQQIIQISSNLESASREVAVEKLETLEVMQLVKHQIFGAGEFISNLTNGMEHLQDQQETLSAKLENSGKVAAALESKLLTVSGILDSILVVASYYRYLVGTGILLLCLCFGGWPILTLVAASMIKLLWITFNKLKELAQLVFLAAGNSLSSATSAAQQGMDWKGAVFLISSVAGIAFYSVAVETPTAYYQRWENGELSLFEPAHCVIITVVFLGLLCVISRYAVAIRESRLLQSGEFEGYDDKESVV